MGNATFLLGEIQQGKAEAANQLLELVQFELRQLAGKLWGDWPPDQTLQPTLLMDMAWERLVGFQGDLKKIVPTTFLTGDVLDPAGLVRKIHARRDLVAAFIYEPLSEVTRRTLEEVASGQPCPPALPAALVERLNHLVKGPSIYEAQRFAAVTLRAETREWLARKSQAVKGCRRLNRLLLEDAYPAELSRELHKEQFLRFAALTMKRILWEAKAGKQGRPPVDGGDALENLEVAGLETPADRLLAVQDAVDALVAAHPEPGRLVKLLCYEGKTMSEAAQAMNLTLITAKRRWEFAKAWLFNKLKPNAG